MANTIKPKRSNTANKVPNTTELISGELGVNMADRKIYINNGTSVVQVGAGRLSALNDVTITSPTNGQNLTYNGTSWINTTPSSSGTVTSVGITPSTGVTVSNSPITTSGNITVGLSTKLTAIENLSGAGFFTQNGSGVIAGRTIQAGTGISVAHGNGSSQDPTIEIDSTVATLIGTQTLTNKTIESAVLNNGYTEEVFAISDGASVNLDPNNGSIQTWALGASRTPDQANWSAGQSITLMIDDGTDYTVTWTTLAVVWKTDGGVAPTLNTSGFTVIVLWKTGTTIYGARVGDA